VSEAIHVDNQLTASRQELKFRVQRSGAKRIAKELGRHLGEHRFTGPGANTLPGARHFVTTVYFDTAAGELHATALKEEGSLKVRAKEYYDQNLALTELVRSRDQMVHCSPILWVEIKESHDTRSAKRRIGIPKSEVASFFSTGEISTEMLDIQRRVHADDSQRVIDELLEVCRRFSTPLRPSVLVNYRRNAWQDEGESLRVTIDRELAFFLATDTTWPGSPRLEREYLGPKIGSDPEFIVEVKSLGSLPSWLGDLLLSQAGDPVRTSKFLAASEALARATKR